METSAVALPKTMASNAPSPWTERPLAIRAGDVSGTSPTTAMPIPFNAAQATSSHRRRTDGTRDAASAAATKNRPCSTKPASTSA